MFKSKKLWTQLAPPIRVFKLKKPIMLVTGSTTPFTIFLYDGKYFRAAHEPANDYWDLIYEMYGDYFEELTDRMFYKEQS